MEVVVRCDKSVHLDASCRTGSSNDPNNSIECNSTDLCMNDLKTCLAECLNINDVAVSTSGLSLCSRKNNAGNDGVRGHKCVDAEKVCFSSSSSDKCLTKSATFPSLGNVRSSEGVYLDGEAKHEEEEVIGGTGVSKVNVSAECFSRSVSLPVPLKLISAMKGSREKQGLPPKHLSVTWAPDVYDPIPTSVSHVPSAANQRYRGGNGKKYGKYKQKGGGKNSRGGGKGKDKKQGRQNNVAPNNKLKLYNDNSGAVSFGKSQAGGITTVSTYDEPESGGVDFNIRSVNSSCERSFLNASHTKLHFPAAEAK